MPSQSKAQQRFMGMVHAAQKGELDNPSPEVAKVAKDMSDKDAKDYASTSHKGLPNHVKQEILNRLKKEYGLMLSGHNIKPAAPAQSLEDLEGVNENMITEKQFKGLDGISPNTSLEKITNDQKLKIIKAPGNIIDFIVPKGVSRNFWQVIGTGKIKKNLAGEFYLEGKIINSPMFKSLDDLIKGVKWKSMEERRRFNESVSEAKEIKWQDVEVGDAANVKSINKTGLIIKTYGRKFHLKFPNGTTKTYDANELSFVKQESVNPEEINTSVIPAALKVRFERALELTQGKELTYNQKLKLLAMVIDSLGVDKSELSKISSKLKTNLD
jgi:hypothetical protein